jgi:nitroimidazol reductase NimA-like FMN-containing flavoprotein (pyridoxamine 5'-phosphate oxidase superfamily)
MMAKTASGGTDLGRRIREQRDRAALSLAETAERAGLAAGYLAYLESSQDPNPTQATLARLAAALGTSPGALSGAGLTLPPGQRAAAANPVLTSLTADECRALIAPGGVGRVLFVEPGRGPVAIPVNYRMDGPDVVFRTSRGAAIAQTISQGPVSFDVDHLDETLGEGWSVLVTGTARVISASAELDRAAALGVEPWAGGERPVYVRLRVRQVTGRAIRVTD